MGMKLQEGDGFMRSPMPTHTFSTHHEKKVAIREKVHELPFYHCRDLKKR
jgi:hypothetical protein